MRDSVANMQIGCVVVRGQAQDFVLAVNSGRIRAQGLNARKRSGTSGVCYPSLPHFS